MKCGGFVNGLVEERLGKGVSNCGLVSVRCQLYRSVFLLVELYSVLYTVCVCVCVCVCAKVFSVNIHVFTVYLCPVCMYI